MASSDPVDIMLTHNHWATKLIIEACAKLTTEQFHQRFEMGPGSLHDTVTHILGAMRVWSDVLAKRERRPRPEGTTRTPAELLAMLEETVVDFAAHVNGLPLDEVLEAPRAGKIYTFTRGTVVTHAMTHGVHHRAQALNMLRQLGVTPGPMSSVIEWSFTVDAPQ
jgi:uncharacterized damage-inducible protein DinB